MLKSIIGRFLSIIGRSLVATHDPIVTLYNSGSSNNKQYKTVIQSNTKLSIFIKRQCIQVDKSHISPHPNQFGYGVHMLMQMDCFMELCNTILHSRNHYKCRVIWKLRLNIYCTDLSTL